MRGFVLDVKGFSYAKFKSYAENVVLKILNSYLVMDFDSVKHLLSPLTLERLIGKRNSEKYQYSNVNFLSNNVIRGITTIDRYSVQLEVCVSYDKKQGLEVNNVKETFLLTFEKLKSYDASIDIKNCTSCGAVIDIDTADSCKYCGEKYHLSHMGWYLSNYERVTKIGFIKRISLGLSTYIKNVIYNFSILMTVVILIFILSLYILFKINTLYFFIVISFFALIYLILVIINAIRISRLRDRNIDSISDLYPLYEPGVFEQSLYNIYRNSQYYRACANVFELKKYVSKEMFDLYNNQIKYYEKSGNKYNIDDMHLYDMYITSAYLIGDNLAVDTYLSLSFMGYKTSNDGKIVAGSKEVMSYYCYSLTFVRLDHDYNCPNCNVNIGTTRLLTACPYCKTPIKEDTGYWVLYKKKTINRYNIQ